MIALAGLDITGDQAATAVVTEANGRRRIQSLALTAAAERASLPEDALVGLVVPDNEVIVKQLEMHNGSAIATGMRLQFEMVQGLLDGPEHFRFDTLPTGITNRYLGLIYRERRLRELFERTGIVDGLTTSCLVRAAALGRGYTAFCQVAGGELQVVVDVVQPRASVCLLFRGEIASLGFVPIPEGDRTSDQWLRRLAIDLKTITSFKQASLAEMGIRLPLANIVVAGELADSRLMERLEGLYSARIAAACMDASYLEECVKDCSTPEHFLPALGMTVI